MWIRHRRSVSAPPHQTFLHCIIWLKFASDDVLQVIAHTRIPSYTPKSFFWRPFIAPALCCIASDSCSGPGTPSRYSHVATVSCSHLLHTIISAFPGAFRFNETATSQSFFDLNTLMHETFVSPVLSAPHVCARRQRRAPLAPWSWSYLQSTSITSR